MSILFFQLHRSTKDDVERKCKFLLRKCKFNELVQENPVSALEYLQKCVSQLVSGSNEEETAEVKFSTNFN